MQAGQKQLKKEVILPLVGLQKDINPTGELMKPTKSEISTAIASVVIGIGLLYASLYHANGFWIYVLAGVGAVFLLMGLFGFKNSTGPKLVNEKGVIKITPNAIYLKIGDNELATFKAEELNYLQFQITEYDGETRTEDMLSRSNRFNVRSGEKNYVKWQAGETVYQFNIKIGNEFEFKRTKLYLNEICKLIPV